MRSVNDMARFGRYQILLNVKLLSLDLGAIL